MIASMLAFTAWGPSYFVRETGMELRSAGYLFGMALLFGGLVGGPIGGLLADRGSRKRNGGAMDFAAWTALAVLPLLAVAVIFADQRIGLVAAVLTPLPMMAFFPATIAMTAELVPPGRLGMAYALNVFFVGGIGSALGPFAIGFLSDTSGGLGQAMTFPFITVLVAAAAAGATARRVQAGRPGGSAQA